MEFNPLTCEFLIVTTNRKSFLKFTYLINDVSIKKVNVVIDSKRTCRVKEVLSTANIILAFLCRNLKPYLYHIKEHCYKTYNRICLHAIWQIKMEKSCLVGLYVINRTISKILKNLIYLPLRSTYTHGYQYHLQHLQCNSDSYR